MLANTNTNTTRRLTCRNPTSSPDRRGAPHLRETSVSKTIDDFGKALHLMRGDIDHLRSVLVAVQTMDGPMLKNLGIVRNSELADMKFFLEKLLSTGFLD